MAYCIRCGVELGAGEERCPLCHTPVRHPDVTVDPTQRPYPAWQGRREEPVSRSGVLLLVSLGFLLPVVICFLCDFLLHGGLSWFPYVGGGLLLLYTVMVLPLWFRRPEPVSLVCTDFAVLILYLLCIDKMTGGDWFLSFAFPVAGGAGVIAVTVTALLRYVHKGYLYIFGGAIIAVGGYTMLIELFLNLAFHVRERLLWSYFPMAACLLLGIALFIIAMSSRLRESLHKKFFL